METASPAPVDRICGTVPFSIHSAPHLPYPLPRYPLSPSLPFQPAKKEMRPSILLVCFASVAIATPLHKTHRVGIVPRDGGCSGISLQVVEGDTCESLADESSISLDEFFASNPSIDPSCVDLQIGQIVCVDSSRRCPLPPAPEANGSAAPLPTATSDSSDAPPASASDDASPASGSEVGCPGASLVVVEGDTCESLADESSISLEDFFALNPTIEQSCLDLQINQIVCLT